MSKEIIDPSAIQAEFSQRLTADWLPTYCHDPKRNYAIAGYKPLSNTVTPLDARDFMRALDHKIVIDLGGCKFRMPRSRATEVIFWEGAKAATPRPITLWLEPVITIAAMARLHLDYGWPLDCLGTQSEKWEFDVMVFKLQDLHNEYIAGEVKKTSKELDELLINMQLSCVEGTLDYCSASQARKNAHNKWLGLQRCRAPLFWALGPGGDSRLYEVSYSYAGNIAMSRTDDTQLYFQT